MARTKLGTGRLVLLSLVALLVPLFVTIGPAGAADPAPTPTATAIFYTGGIPRAMWLHVHVRSSTGAVPTGTVSFYRVGDPSPDPYDVVELNGGYARTDVGINEWGPQDSYRAEFHGTGQFADSQGTDTDNLPLKVVPQGTILHLGGPTLLKINLTTAVTVLRADGYPEEGAFVQFTTSKPATDPYDPATLCRAYVDLKGYASCQGQMPGTAILSVLGGGYATVSTWNNPTFSVAKIPSVTVAQ
jgi:hypothetical protein